MGTIADKVNDLRGGASAGGQTEVPAFNMFSVGGALNLAVDVPVPCGPYSFIVDRIAGRNPISFTVTRGPGLPAGVIVATPATLSATESYSENNCIEWTGVGAPGNYTFTIVGTDTVTGATASTIVNVSVTV